MKALRRLLLALACVPVVPAAAQAATTRSFDPAHTEVRFDVRTRWGQAVGGAFARHDGQVQTLPDGRMRVRLELQAGSVEVAGSPRYTALARGPAFFDAERHPTILFVSEPHGAELLRDGGTLAGKVTLNGVRLREAFTVEPAGCARPGVECDVVARGRVSRAAYGLHDYAWALGDSVRFTLHLRLLPDAAQ